MKLVVHCINSVSSLGGGASYALKAICENVTDVDHLILSCKDENASIIDDGIPQYLFPRIGPYSYSYSRELERYLSELVTSDRDIILHVHGLWSGLSKTINKIRKKNPRIKYIVSPHGMLSSKALGRRKNLKVVLRLISENTLLKYASSIHCLTGQEQGEVKRYNSNLLTFIIPNCLRFPNTSDDVDCHWLKKNEDKKTLLYIGRIHQSKGILKLVVAMKTLIDRGEQIDFNLVIAGFGDDAEVSKIETEINGNDLPIKYVGPVFGEEKHRLLREAHGMVLPSETEGQPISLIEGAAYGLPLFVTRECNFPWIDAANAGLEVPYSESGIQNLLEVFGKSTIDELCRMGKNSFRGGFKHYSSEVVSLLWSDTYINY